MRPSCQKGADVHVAYSDVENNTYTSATLATKNIEERTSSLTLWILATCLSIWKGRFPDFAFVRAVEISSLRLRLQSFEHFIWIVYVLQPLCLSLIHLATDKNGGVLF